MASIQEKRAKDAYPHLVQVAKKRGKITYGELSARIGLAPIQAGPFLGVIERSCMQDNRPPLNAMAVRKDTRIPGVGYKATRTRAEYEEALEQVYDYEWPKELTF